MPRYRRHFAPGQTVFLTLACHERRPWLCRTGARDATLAALRDLHVRLPFRHHGHVLLDDHLHLLLSPLAETGIPRLVGDLKRAVQVWIGKPSLSSRLWQRRYHDHIIRDAQDFARHLDYLHFNPVKHGLVDHPVDWPWSSLRSWIDRGMYPEGWGEVEPDYPEQLAECEFSRMP